MFFQINVTPPAKVKEPENIPQKEKELPAILVLAPFQPQTRINLETTINNSVSSNLRLKNPSNKNLKVKITKLPPQERAIIIDTSDISIDSESEANLLLSWTPLKAGSWRDVLQFTDSRRIKYDVSIITTATSPTKGVGKGKQKSFVQPKEIKKKTEKSRTYLMDTSSVYLNNKKTVITIDKPSNRKIEEDKENTTNNRTYNNDDVFQTPAKVTQNLADELNSNRTITKNNGPLSTLNISDIQLTPVQAPSKLNQISHSTVISSTVITSRTTKIIPDICVINATHDELPSGILKSVPDVQVVNAIENELSITKTVPDIKIINATQDEFQLPNISKVSEHNEEFELRRETYTTTNPKFCRKIHFVLEEDEREEEEDAQEKFEDSLSPPNKKGDASNFSAIINNMNFVTPVKTSNMFSPDIGSTGARRLSMSRLSDGENHSHNGTFNISENSVCGEGFKANNTYELLPTPPGVVQNINSHKMSNIFEKKNPSSDESRINVRSSSPVALDHSKSSLPYSNLLAGDNASVREVLEANLWAKDAQDNYHCIGNRLKLENLEMIAEENLNISSKTYTKSPVRIKYDFSTADFLNRDPRRIDITPPKKLLQRTPTKKMSPIKHNKITKPKITPQNNILKKSKTEIMMNMKKSSKGPLTGVRITKLSLASLKNKSKKSPKKEAVIKLHNPDDLISQICNPDIFAATMTQDPFISHSHYFDEKFIRSKEIEFTKWLNALLTPPEHLDVDIETTCVDVGKVWQSCRTKEIALAESKEEVSARYHTNTQLNTLRKAACMMFNREEVKKALAHSTSCVNKGILVIRQDRDLHRDIGLQKEILELFLSYNPLWLRIGLEVIYGETIPLNSNNDLIGLTRFLITRFFSDPFLVQTYSVSNTVSLKLPAFQGHLNKFILTKFLCIVYFLDYAKRNKLIGHDPCLFHKKAPFKESREILLTFSRLVLSGIGDITKVLRTHNYIVSHKQTCLDEYDYAVKNLCTDLRDGVRLCRVMELIIGDKTLTNNCRLPAISRLQKIHNVELALSALSRAGYNIAGDISAKNISDGHREKTLSLLWQLIHKFQAPRFEKAATTIQKWWRAKLWFIRIKNFLINRKKNAAEVIQRSWKCYKAKTKLKILRKERAVYLKELKEATIIIELQWLRQKKMLQDRRRFLQMKSAAIVIQKWFRRVKTSRPYLQDLQRKREAAIVLQNQWRAIVAMRKEKEIYKRIKKSVILIQNWWRAIILSRLTHDYYKKLRSATIFIQSKWRANKLMRVCRQDYLEIQEASMVIQIWWRNYLVTKNVRNDYLLKKDAVRTIESFWKAHEIGKVDRQQFITIKSSVIIIQRCWSRYRNTKKHIQYFKSCQKAVRVIQPWWRMIKVFREYKKRRNNAIIIQKWWRHVIIMNDIKSRYVSLKKHSILVQKTWKMKQERRKYLKLKAAVMKIQVWYKNWKQFRAIRNDYLIKKSATVLIQRWWRSLKASEQCRSDYSMKRKAVMTIQAQWRAKVIGRSIREKYLNMKKASIKIQSYWRMIKVRNAYLKMLKRKKAAVVLQRRWRARDIGSRIRKEYLKQKSAAILIQRKYRAMKLTKLTKAQYLIYKKAAIVIQKNWKMIKAVGNYRRIKSAVIVLQTQWRARKLAIHHRQNYIEIKRKIVMIQRYYRAKCIAKEVRTMYLKLYQTTVKVQRVWRANKLMKEARRQYLSHRNSAIRIQSWWRMIVERKEYLMKKRAVSKIQIAWKSLILTRNVQNDFLTLKASVIFIQRHFRSIKHTKRIRNEFKKLRKTAIFVQQSWRRKVEIRKQIAEVEAKKRFISAAIAIQSVWRGYMLRKKESAEIRELRERSKKATAAATPSATVEFRLRAAINVLQNVANVGQLSMCLACIETLTRLSPKGCVLFCELNLVDKIYRILEKSNRSLPWMDVCLRCTNILITLIKLPQTSSYVKSLEDTETIARLMNATVRRETDLFLHLATLFWLFLLDDDFVEEIKNFPRTIFLLKTLCSSNILKNSTQEPKGMKNKTLPLIETLLPNPKPDWGLKTKIPRCFTKIQDAILTIKNILNI
ncbi:protein abnormal spindle [Chelonus insularis]|uniref:protein abnormal spindle n=1 Tax=Chelonus insularis TaxID=460826 RepID=UPI00158F182E|nr:protein abnormal spindle [Chelonus insularis]